MLERLVDALSMGLMSSGEIRAALGVSQPTVSRLVKKAGPRVVRVGRGRSTRYGAATEVFDAGLRQPLYAVDPDGVVTHVATLRALRSGGYHVEAHVVAAWLRGEGGTGLFASLPYFLYDLLPAGFIGRQIGRQLSREWGVPPDPRDWSDRHVGQYLLRRGADLPGNLLVGDVAVERFNAEEPDSIADRAEAYPRLAERALAEEVPGSSAAGEQPKFVVHHRDAGHVIVKFSPAGDSPDAVRWRDLLRSEAHALDQLRRLGVQTPRTALWTHGGRVFLESRRFDRVGLRGRRPALSLRMIDAELVGRGQGWTAVAAGLHRMRLLADEDLDRLALAETFGGWIGNSDMHLGNVSLAATAEAFVLLPLYDMLPMAFAPVRGELPRVTLRPPIQSSVNRQHWDRARTAAAAFWSRVADDEQVSNVFRQLAAQEARRCAG